jgi:hypothetical protein
MSEYYHTKINVDDVPVDLLLTEEQVKNAAERAIVEAEHVPSDANSCWPIQCKTTKCGLLKWLMGKCCDCK